MQENKFVVIKTKDINTYLSNHNKMELSHMLNQIKESRQKDNKNINNCYAVINTDEPYFGEIKFD